MTADAHGIHKTEGHSVGTPMETAPGRIELWKNVGSNASIDQVLKNFDDGAGCERNGVVRVKRSRVTITLDDRDDEAGLPSGPEPQ